MADEEDVTIVEYEVVEGPDGLYATIPALEVTIGPRESLEALNEAAMAALEDVFTAILNAELLG